MKITTFSEPKELVKEGLLFYSSNPNEPLIDSRGNAHEVTADDIKALATNTNEYLKYTDIYVYPDHDRDPSKAYGLIDKPGCFQAKEITEDLAEQHPKLKSLVGRWGLFCDNVKLIEETIVDKVSKGLSKSVSIGADLVSKVVKELSITGTPACQGASLFSADISKLVNFNMDTSAVTLEEAIQEKEDDEQLKSEAIELLCKFMAVVENIIAMSDEDLGNYQVASKEELYQSQLEAFMMMLDEKINPFNDMEMMDQQQQVDPRMQPNQMQRYSAPLAITTFDEMDQYISEYGLGSTLKAGMKLASKTTGIGNKTKVMAGAMGKGILGKKKFGAVKSGIGSGVKAVKTGVANAASTGLQKAGSLGNRLGGRKGVMGKVGSSIQKTTASLSDRISNRRLGRYSSSSKLSNFMK